MNKFIVTIGINSFLLSSLLSSAVLAESHTVVTAEYPSNSYTHTGTEQSNTKKEAPFWSASQANAAKTESLLQKRIAENPQGKAAYANLANLYLANNKTKKAIDAYQNAILVDTSNAKLFAGLSIAYLHQSKYSMAKTMAEQAIKLDPKMEHAKKITEYISKKEEIIAQASAQPAMPSGMPADSTHKAMHK